MCLWGVQVLCTHFLGGGGGGTNGKDPKVLRARTFGSEISTNWLFVVSIIIIFLAVTVNYDLVGVHNRDVVLTQIPISRIFILGSLISYLIQCSSHLYLYWKYPDRTCYRSPFGIAGSIITMILCLIIYACIIKQGVKSIIYLYSVIAGLIFLGGGMFYHYAKVFWRRRSKSESRDTLIGGQEGKNEDT